MQIDVPEIIEIPDYTDSDRYSDLKNKTFSLAKSKKPFYIDELSSAEYMYYSKMHGIFTRLLAKKITPEQAKLENDVIYKEFADEQTLYNSRLFELIEFNQRIKASEAARIKINKAETRAQLVDGVIECIEALTNDKTMRVKLGTLKEGD